jgi:hypothetical protein
MKKIFTKRNFFLCMITAFTGTTYAQNEKFASSECEAAPVLSSGITTFSNPPSTQAMWSIVYNYDLLATVGANGNAGVCFVGNEFWVSRWATDTLYRLDATGAFLQKFTVSGVTGVRSLTTDGTFIYAGQNTNSIAKIDPTTKTVVSTITAPVTNVRSLTFDPTVAGGGFWASTWATDITQFDMAGTTGSIVSAASHGLTGMYGTAFDNVSYGGPYLWVFDQATSAAKSDIVQINVATQLQTGVIHDVMSDVGPAASDTSGLAGGLFFYTNTSNSVLTIAGVLQGGPTNRLFGYEVGITGINENSNPDEFITVFPNPVKDMVNINVKKQNNDDVHMQIFDAMGKIVFDKNTRGQNNYINFSKQASGIYFVRTTFNGKTASSKFIKE